MAMMPTPQEFLQDYMGWGFDIDGAAGKQCVDLAKLHFMLAGVPNYTDPIGGDGYADNIWYNRERWASWYDFIPFGEFRDGDMVVFPHKDRGGWTHPYSHVCFWYGGKEFGMNQGVPEATLKNTDWSDALGALRYKGWNQKAEIPVLSSDLEINGHKYSLYRQRSDMKTVVLSAGLNQLAAIEDLDADVDVLAKITGAHYFQNDPNNPAGRPFGETYGDISAPLNNVFRELPNQDTTLFHDIETGQYGDCTGIYLANWHNVFSPSVVYPQAGNYQYARMVGISHVNVVSTYTFMIQFDDLTCAIGIALQEMTPKQIAEDFRSAFNFRSISFLDGGGSAQMCRWVNGSMQYIHKTDRKCPSAVAIVSIKSNQSAPPVVDPVVQEEDPVVEPVVEEPEEQPEEENNQLNIPDPIQDMDLVFQDPDEEEYEDEEEEQEPMEEKEEKEVTVREQTAKLIDVKSIITFMVVATLCYLQIVGREPSQAFITAVTAVLTFYFSRQTNKGSGDQK